MNFLTDIAPYLGVAALIVALVWTITIDLRKGQNVKNSNECSKKHTKTKIVSSLHAEVDESLWSKSAQTKQQAPTSELLDTPTYLRNKIDIYDSSINFTCSSEEVS